MVRFIPPLAPPPMAMGSEDEVSDPMNISASRRASALHASSTPSILPDCGDWSMVSNMPPDPPPLTRRPARPLTTWPSADVPNAPAGRDDRTCTGATGWKPTMGFPECVTESSRAPPLLVRSWEMTRGI